MSIWASLGDDSLAKLPDRGEYGEVEQEGTSQSVDVATSGLSDAIRLCADGANGSARLYLSPVEAREIAHRLTQAAEMVEADAGGYRPAKAGDIVRP